MTVLNTHQGLCRYYKVAFDFASAPARFQRPVESFLRELPRVKVVYLNSIIVADKENDKSTLRQGLQRQRDNSIKLNEAKYRFRERQVAFLGHTTDVQGLHPQREKLKAVTAALRPTSVSQLK